MSGAATLLDLFDEASRIMTPLAFAALGGLFTELSGTLNVALEGLVTVGAFAGAAAAAAMGGAAWGMAGAVLASCLVAALYGYITLRLEANEFITGLATNLLASGLVAIASQGLFGTKGVVPVPMAAMPRLDLAALAAAAVAWIAISATPFGLRLRAAGASPAALVALGRDPRRYRFAAALISGAACGLAGGALSLGLAAYVPNLSSGRGWIALVAVYLGGKTPWGTLAACFAFALAEAFSNYAQGFLKVPSDFILAAPYIVTLCALVIGAAARRARGR